MLVEDLSVQVGWVVLVVRVTRGKGETWTGNLRDYRRPQMPSRYNTFHVNCLEPRVHIRAGFARVFLTSYCASYMRSLKSPGNA